MTDPFAAIAQLLSPARAEALRISLDEAWSGLSRMLAAILGAEPSLTMASTRLVMPAEIAPEFNGEHLAFPIELSPGDASSAIGFLVLDSAAATAFFGDAPGTEQTAGALATQVIQALNSTVFAGGAGPTLALGNVVPNGMPVALSILDEACIAIECTLQVTTALPLQLVLPASVLELLAPLPYESPVAPSVDEPASASGEFEEPTPIASAPRAQRAHFAPLPEPTVSHAPSNIALLSDLEMNVSVELGRTEMSLADVLSLGSGSVIELDRIAGEPVDILVNDRIIARGEVVVVDENFGVRIVEVLPRSREAGKAS